MDVAPQNDVSQNAAAGATNGQLLVGFQDLLRSVPLMYCFDQLELC